MTEQDDELDDDDGMAAAIAANQRALDEAYCTVANEWDIKCAKPAEFLLTVGDDDDNADAPTLREPVCADHLAWEIEMALGGGWDHVDVRVFERHP